VIFAALISVQLPNTHWYIKSDLTETQSIDSIFSCIPAYINIFDDESISKYIWPDTTFNIIDYRPNDLVSISGDFLLSSRWPMSIRQEAMLALSTLSEVFYTQFGSKLDIVSGYRSYAHQKRIAAWCSPSVCARPWHSEHQWWLAIDLFDFSNAGKFLANDNRRLYYIRLMEYAHEYGWHNSYQKGIDVDGYHPEPRHWRYLGVELATYLYEKWMTFAEYVLSDHCILEE
jgi:D-alanyl-D-alanine carboxypeptidase